LDNRGVTLQTFGDRISDVLNSFMFPYLTHPNRTETSRNTSNNAWIDNGKKQVSLPEPADQHHFLTAEGWLQMVVQSSN